MPKRWQYMMTQIKNQNEIIFEFIYNFIEIVTCWTELCENKKISKFKRSVNYIFNRIIICGLNNIIIREKNFNVKPVLAVRPSSVTDNLRGGYYTTLGYESVCDSDIVTVPLHSPKSCNIPLSSCRFLKMVFHYMDEKK